MNDKAKIDALRTALEAMIKQVELHAPTSLQRVGQSDVWVRNDYSQKAIDSAKSVLALTADASEPVNAITFGKRGDKMTFTIGVQTFTLDYEPEDDGQFRYMCDMLTRAICRASTAPIEETAPGMAEALNTILWLYRRLPRAYERPPHIECVINALARKTGTDVESFLTERGAATPAPIAEQAPVEGWRLVPVDAPTAMIIAIEAAIDRQLEASGLSPRQMQRQDGGDIYDAMLAAAPAAPVADTGAVCPIDLAHPVGEKRRVVIASDEMIDGERVLCIAIKDPDEHAKRAEGAIDPERLPDQHVLIGPDYVRFGFGTIHPELARLCTSISKALVGEYELPASSAGNAADGEAT